MPPLQVRIINIPPIQTACTTFIVLCLLQIMMITFPSCALPKAHPRFISLVVSALTGVHLVRALAFCCCRKVHFVDVLVNGSAIDRQSDMRWSKEVECQRPSSCLPDRSHKTESSNNKEPLGGIDSRQETASDGSLVGGSSSSEHSISHPDRPACPDSVLCLQLSVPTRAFTPSL